MKENNMIQQEMQRRFWYNRMMNVTARGYRPYFAGYSDNVPTSPFTFNGTAYDKLSDVLISLNASAAVQNVLAINKDIDIDALEAEIVRLEPIRKSLTIQGNGHAVHYSQIMSKKSDDTNSNRLFCVVDDANLTINDAKLISDVLYSGTTYSGAVRFDSNGILKLERCEVACNAKDGYLYAAIKVNSGNCVLKNVTGIVHGTAAVLEVNGPATSNIESCNLANIHDGTTGDKYTASAICFTNGGTINAVKSTLTGTGSRAVVCGAESGGKAILTNCIVTYVNNGNTTQAGNGNGACLYADMTGSTACEYEVYGGIYTMPNDVVTAERSLKMLHSEGTGISTGTKTKFTLDGGTFINFGYTEPSDHNEIKITLSGSEEVIAAGKKDAFTFETSYEGTSFESLIDTTLDKWIVKKYPGEDKLSYVIKYNEPVVIPALDSLIDIRNRLLAGDSCDGERFIQISDIDMSQLGHGAYASEKTSWDGIGGKKGTNPFKGEYNGNGFAINNLLLSRGKTYRGVFNSVEGGKIHNLTINLSGYGFADLPDGYTSTVEVDNIEDLPTTGDISTLYVISKLDNKKFLRIWNGSSYVWNDDVCEYGGAAAVGYITNGTVVEDITVNGKLGEYDPENGSKIHLPTHNVAGIVCGSKSTTSDYSVINKIVNCTNNANIANYYTKAGGILAFNEANSGNHSVDGCTNNGNVISLYKTSEEGTGVGGIIGWCSNAAGTTSTVFLKNCKNTGTVTTNGTYCGQLFGYDGGYQTVEGDIIVSDTGIIAGWLNTTKSVLCYGMQNGSEIKSNMTPSAGGEYVILYDKTPTTIKLQSGQSVTIDHKIVPYGTVTCVVDSENKPIEGSLIPETTKYEYTAV